MRVKEETPLPPWAVYTPPPPRGADPPGVKREEFAFMQPEGQAPWKTVPPPPLPKPDRAGFTTLTHPRSKRGDVPRRVQTPEPDALSVVVVPRKTVKKGQGNNDDNKNKVESSVLLCAKNYDAVEAGREAFGLIDQGVTHAGVRNVLIHVRRTARPCWAILNGIRVGSTIMALKGEKGSIPSPLRVRFTTPSRYYTPSAKVTSMLIGVNEVDWQSLMQDARRI